MEYVRIKSDYLEFNKKLAKDERKFKLIKAATLGLFAAGAFSAIVAYAKVDDNFEYDNNSNETLSEAYEEYADAEIDKDVKKVLDTLSTYEELNDQYEEISKLDGVSHDDLVSKRMELIKSVKSLKSAANKIIKLQVMSSMDLSDDAHIEIIDVGNKADGPSHSIFISDGDNNYVINSLPFEYEKTLEYIDKINTYSGDGSSDAWDGKTMDEYQDIVETLYYRILNISTNDPNFKYKVDKSR
ncbi:MAG: hypothetical protein IJ565_02440 [Bacilli bacterium]|nr:hypothetical protein [Bacilli bacterium]